jgi:hypothetical protein
MSSPRRRRDHAERRGWAAELAPEGVGEVAMVGVAEVEGQRREVRFAGRQPVHGQPQPQAVEIPS